MTDEGEMLFRDSDFELFKNKNRFVLTRFGDGGERLTDTFFSTTRELTQGDIELMSSRVNGGDEEIVVGLVRDKVSRRLLQELREV